MSLKSLLEAAAGEMSLSSAFGRWARSVTESLQESQQGSGQVMLFGGGTTVIGESSFLFAGGDYTTVMIQTSQDQVVAFDGLIRKLSVHMNNPTGTNDNLTFTIRKTRGTVTTGISVTIDSNETNVLEALGENYPVNEGDTLSVVIGNQLEANACWPVAQIYIEPR